MTPKDILIFCFLAGAYIFYKVVEMGRKYE